MIQKSTLDNGLRAVTTSMPHTRSVTIAFFVGAGSRYEPDDKAGVSHFIEHLCFKGTPRRPSPKEISEAIEGVGGVMNAGTEQEVTVYWCKVARPHFQLALDLLTDMLRFSLFDPLEVEKERRVIVEELASTNDHPESRVELLMDELMWPDQPMGRDIGGTKESVTTMASQDIRSCLAAQYTPSNIVLSVAGDISHSEVVESAAPYMQGWESAIPLSWSPALDGQVKAGIRVERRKTDQAYFSVAFKGLSLVHPDRHALDLLSTVLGEGMSSRLFIELRERQGLVYDVHSYVNHFLDCGAFGVSASVDPARAPDALSTVLQELRRLKDGVEPRELEKAKEMAKGRLLLRMEDSRSVAYWAGAQEKLLGSIQTVEQAIEKVEAITAADLTRVAEKVVASEKLNLAVVGPYRSAKAFRSVLAI
ncbi:MAG: insulinase family protein [Chloroflexi bacterium]|nr:insulinase family protein [Chloroflexota bacterium]